MGIRVIETALAGVVVIETDFFRDERGFFIESYHRQRYFDHGLRYEFVQDNHSRSAKNVLRGLHYQDTTAPMAKLIRCTVGRILDVAVDLRVSSPTFGKWVAEELSAENQRQMLVPAGFGHGFLTLSDLAEVQYKCDSYYAPASEGSVCWDDPHIGIEWGISAPILSQKDRNAPTLAQYLERPAFQ